MRKLILCFALVLGLASAGDALAADMKIGVVDFNRAMNDVNEGKQALANLETMLAPKQKELEAEQSELQRMGAEFETQAPVLSADARAKKEAELRQKAMTLQQKNMMAQEEAARMFQAINDDLKTKLQSELSKIAKAKGYTLVIESSLVMYGGEGMDLTDDLIKAYNAANAK